VCKQRFCEIKWCFSLQKLASKIKSPHPFTTSHIKRMGLPSGVGAGDAANFFRQIWAKLSKI